MNYRSLFRAHPRLGDVICSIDPATGGRVCTDSNAPNLPTSIATAQTAVMAAKQQSLRGARPWMGLSRPDLVPQDSRPFFRVSQPYPNFPAPGAAAITLITYTVPRGFNAVINMMAIFMATGGFVNGTGNAIWRVLINDASYKNLDNIQSQFGTDQLPLPIYLPLVENDTISVTAEQPNGGNIGAGSTTGARLHGYEYPTGKIQ